MDNVRLALLFALGFVLLLLWQAWQRDYGPRPTPTSPAVSSPQPSSLTSSAAEVPSAEVQSQSPKPAPGPSSSASAETHDPVIRVKTDVLDVEISTRGGTLVRANLLKYPDSAQDSSPFELLADSALNLFLAQSGLIGTDPALAPTHQALFTALKTQYALADGQDALTVDLVWTHSPGIQVTKRFQFHRGSYLVDVSQQVVNHSGATWAARDYHQLERVEPPPNPESRFVRTFTGAAMYSPEHKFKKLSFENIRNDKYDQDVVGGWISMVQHYFLAAWVPSPHQSQHFFTKSLPGGRYLIGMYGPIVSVPDGHTEEFSSRIWIGPELQYQLAEVAPGLDLTVDYGWLTIIAQPIFWLLTKLHALVGNWGWAIILLTILIKLGFFKLSETSYKSMANMRRMAPRLQQIKERYGDDKQRLNQAMMELYKKEKINPLGGCLPIVVQIPVFIALYWVLLESVELRNAPFMLWIHSLSAKDPYFVLPVIMGISMLIQQKLNPAPPDPMQAKLMMALPFVFTAFFAFFPAGLVLYWVVNNILSISQQWYITRKIDQAAKARG